jgi:phosphoribosylformylglycinamidine synthase subunit PurS
VKKTVHVTISLKEGLLDPEARAIQHALGLMGYGISAVKASRSFTLSFDADSDDDAKEKAAAMCERLLANPIIHTSTIELVP